MKDIVNRLLASSGKKRKDIYTQCGYSSLPSFSEATKTPKFKLLANLCKATNARLLIKLQSGIEIDITDLDDGGATGSNTGEN